MGGLSGEGGGDDGLPSLTPQWMRGGSGGAKGASLTSGATAGGNHHRGDAVPQLPPQLVRSGSAERLNGSGPPNGGGRNRRQHGGRNGRHHNQPQHQPQHHHPVLNMELHAVPPMLAPAPPVPASPKPPRSGAIPPPDPFPRRAAAGAEPHPNGLGAGPAANGLHGVGTGVGGGSSGPAGVSMADVVDTWGHAGHTTTAGGYSNFDRGRGGGAAAAVPASPGARVAGAGGRGRPLPASPRRGKGSGGHRGGGGGGAPRGGSSRVLGAASWGEFDEEERPRPPRLRTASFSPRAAAGDRGGDFRGDRGGDRNADGGGGSLRSALLSPKRGSWRSSGSSDAVWTSRLAETPLQGRTLQQPNSARPSDLQGNGSAELGRSQSLPLGGQSTGPRAVARAGSGGSAGSGASSGEARVDAMDAALVQHAGPVPASLGAPPADGSPTAMATAAAAAVAADNSLPAPAPEEPPAEAPMMPSTQLPPSQPVDSTAPSARAANGPPNPGAPASLLLGLSLRPGQLRSGCAPKPYSPAKHAFGGGAGGDAAQPAAADDPASMPGDTDSPGFDERLAEAAAAAGDSPNAAATVAEVAKEVEEDAKDADAEELPPASSGNLLPAAEDSFLASLGWSDCTDETGPGLSAFKVPMFGEQQNGGASLHQYD